MRPLLLAAVLAALPAGPALAAEPDGDVIRHIRPHSELDQRNRYFLDALELALEKSRAEYGDYRLQPLDETMGQGRAVALLSQDRDLDVVWTMTSREREEHLRPVRIPLLKGLMGFRLLIIRADDQPWFSHIRTLDQLRQLRAGQGHDWPDAAILRANELPLVTMDSYEGMFRMLDEGRFDYLPRAVNEPWEEVEDFEHLDLAVEQQLVLYYPAAAYFFVSPDNERLAERLRAGLEAAIADGSFDELFRDHPVNSRAFDQARLLKRRLIKLHNPLLPEATPLDRGDLWWLPPERQKSEPADDTSRP